MRTVIKNIKSLVQVEDKARLAVCGKDMAEVKCIDNAYLLIEDGIIKDFGTMDSCPNADKEIDATGRFVLPSFCDSHTHLVYAGSREIEYIDKIKGLSYEEIAERGGGIVNSALRLQKASEEELYDDAMQRLEGMIKLGTGAVEIKSGYGFTTEAELKMLRVIRKLKENSQLTIKANFLGAHGVPMEYRGNIDAFVDKIVDEMIPKVADEGLADFIDVFCDKGFFTVEQTDRMLFEGVKRGLKPKIHANELAASGGIQVGVKYNALSVDHLEYTGDAEIECLKASQTMPTILPGAAFFLNMQCAPARKMMQAGLPIAMASDFNPGSSPSGNMQLILTFACVNYKLTPQEAINATTINTAYAMDVVDKLGSICKGKVANFYITKEIPSIEYLPYYYGENKVEKVFLNGKEIQ
ncbi:MAG: imidazolonepropionase [Bacteroidales bacterium]|nr:imidazolonepropionase [Candidatus Scybalousia scybalohippi]